MRDPWLLGALLVGLVLRLARLDHAPLWFDEVITANWLTLPWGEMVRTAVTDNHPPLYFVVLKAWAALAGSTAWALRLPSALASWLTVPFTAGAAGVLAGRHAARWAAWLAALSPFVIHHGQEARMYALVSMLAAADLFLLARFVTGAAPSLGWLFVGTSAALVAAHYYSVFFVAGALLTLLVLRPRPLRTWVPAAVATSLATGAALLAVLVLARHRTGGQYELGWVAFPGTIWSMLAGYTLLPSSEELHAAGWRAALPYAPVAMVAAIAFAIACLASLRSANRTTRVVLVAMLGTVLAGPFAVRVILPVSVNPRYAVAGVPVLLALLAIGPATSARAGAGTLAVVVLAATLLVGTARHLLDPAGNREDIRAAGVWLDSHVPPAEEIVITSPEMEYLARFHWPQRRFRLYPTPGVVAGPQNAAQLADAFPFPPGDRAIYLVGRAWLSDPGGALQEAVTARHPSCEGAQVRGIRILCLERPDAESAGGITRAAQPRTIE